MVLRRIGAYILDFLIVMLVITIIGNFFPTNHNLESKLSDQISEMMNVGKVSDESMDEIADTAYELSKEGIALSITSIIVYYLYFAVLPVYNNGKTLGKMATRIKIKSPIGDKLSLWQTSLRGVFIYQYLFDLIDVFLIIVLSKSNYMSISTPLSNIQAIILFICLLTIIFNNGIGMHDYFGKTIVVLDKEDEEEETHADKWKGNKKTTTRKSINSDRIKNHTKRKGE